MALISVSESVSPSLAVIVEVGEGIVVTTEEVSSVITTETQTVVVEGTQGLPGKDGNVSVSTDPGNAMIRGTDEGLYVSDDIGADPLAFYILSRS